jgi:hypothetical protein
MSELDWSTERTRKDFDGVLKIAVPFGDDLIVNLSQRRRTRDTVVDFVLG